MYHIFFNYWSCKTWGTLSRAVVASSSIETVISGKRQCFNSTSERKAINCAAASKLCENLACLRIYAAPVNERDIKTVFSTCCYYTMLQILPSSLTDNAAAGDHNHTDLQKLILCNQNMQQHYVSMTIAWWYVHNCMHNTAILLTLNNHRSHTQESLCHCKTCGLQSVKSR